MSGKDTHTNHSFQGKDTHTHTQTILFREKTHTHTQTHTALDIYVSVILKVNSLQFHTNNAFVLVLNRHEILAAMEVELQTINHAKMSLFSTHIPFN